MKTIRIGKGIIVFALSFVCIALYSCEWCKHDEFEPPYMTRTVAGTASISNDTVKIGDSVTLSINPFIIVHDGNSIKIEIAYIEGGIEQNGKIYGIPMVHYYIDGFEVGKSNNHEQRFAFQYTVSGLKEGTHTLSATAEPQEESTTFNGEYQSSTFTVVSVD